MRIRICDNCGNGGLGEDSYSWFCSDLCRDTYTGIEWQTVKGYEHVVMFSGGGGSWASAKRVAQHQGVDNLELLFTDTLIEDEDLYRFLVQSAANVFGLEINIEKYNNLIQKLPLVESNRIEERKERLKEIQEEATSDIPGLKWVDEGRTPWEVFKDRRFLGNSRIDPCSLVLKRKFADDWLDLHKDMESTIVYVGIDWTEIHRYERLVPRKLPWVYKAPLTEEPYIDKDQVLEWMKNEGIKIPKLYEMGFSHNNCGGFCIKAGQGHFITLLEQMPERYDYHMEMEQEIRETLGDVSILKRTVQGETQRLTLENLKNEYKGDRSSIDFTDFGGCGCFLDDGD